MTPPPPGQAEAASAKKIGEMEAQAQRNLDEQADRHKRQILMVTTLAANQIPHPLDPTPCTPHPAHCTLHLRPSTLDRIF